LAAKGIKTRVDHRFFVEKSGWNEKAKAESMENIKTVAKEEFTDPGQREKYVEFMKESFVDQPGNYTVEHYAREWAGRFKKGKEWTYSDYDRRKVLKQMFPKKYGDKGLDWNPRDGDVQGGGALQ
jgi:hypothetical protein